MGDNITFELSKDGYITRTHTTLGTNASKIEARRKPSDEEWKAFWRDTMPLHLSEWKRSYETSDVPSHERVIISDGWSWTFSCRSAAFRVRSSGHNAYPTVGKPQIATLDTTSFNRLMDALNRIAKPTRSK